MAVLFLPQDLPQGQAAPTELQTSCSSPRAAGHLPGLRLVRLGLSGDSRPFTRGAVSTPGAPCCGMVAHGLRVGARPHPKPKERLDSKGGKVGGLGVQC